MWGAFKESGTSYDNTTTKETRSQYNFITLYNLHQITDL